MIRGLLLLLLPGVLWSCGGSPVRHRVVYLEEMLQVDSKEYPPPRFLEQITTPEGETWCRENGACYLAGEVQVSLDPFTTPSAADEFFAGFNLDARRIRLLTGSTYYSVKVPPGFEKQWISVLSGQSRVESAAVIPAGSPAP